VIADLVHVLLDVLLALACVTNYGAGFEAGRQSMRPKPEFLPAEITRQDLKIVPRSARR
jgi:hypothetical protein